VTGDLVSILCRGEERKIFKVADGILNATKNRRYIRIGEMNFRLKMRIKKVKNSLYETLIRKSSISWRNRILSPRYICLDHSETECSPFERIDWAWLCNSSNSMVHAFSTLLMELGQRQIWAPASPQIWGWNRVFVFGLWALWNSKFCRSYIIPATISNSSTLAISQKKSLLFDDRGLSSQFRQRIIGNIADCQQCIAILPWKINTVTSSLYPKRIKIFRLC
jgi:hypothetical protein